MSKVLNVSDMIAAAEECKLPDAEKHVVALEMAAQHLALDLARHLGVRVKEHAEYWDREIAVSFGPVSEGQKCPKVIDEGDEGGEWE